MRNKLNSLSINLIRLTAIFALSISQAYASTPSEMAGMSLQELFEISIDESTDSSGKNNPWQLGILYKRLELDEYLDGTKELSNNDVLFDGVEPRTDKNFPVLPTVIVQEVLITNISYEINDVSSASVSIPLIRQSTDHESIVSGYSTFNISSGGLGDITLNYNGIVKSWVKQQINFSIGLSIPTGSIDQKGDTPRASGDQQLPYTMQLGSGTWDIPAGLNYQKNESTWIWGTKLLGKVRIGKNDRNYRLGNMIAFSAWGKWRVKERIQPILKLIYQKWDHIHGADNELLSPGLFPYPAGITNPNFYGGEKINMTLGTEISFNNQDITIELSAPVYQSLKGVQPKEIFNFSINWNTKF